MCLLLSVLPEKKPQPKHGEVKLETLLGFSHSLVVPIASIPPKLFRFFIASPVSSVASAFAAADTTTAATFQR